MDRVVDWFHTIGLSAVTDVEVEIGLNVVLFVPLSLLGTFLFRPGLVRWLLAGFAASAVVEVVQGALLPSRTATLSDLVANTAGSGVGAALALLLVLWRRRG